MVIIRLDNYIHVRAVTNRMHANIGSIREMLSLLRVQQRINIVLNLFPGNDIEVNF